MTLRNPRFKSLYKQEVFQLIAINQRHPSKKRIDNKTIHFGLNDFSYINQLVKIYQNAPDNILLWRLDNNNYEAGRPHN
jgi:hypothetical protein